MLHSLSSFVISTVTFKALQREAEFQALNKDQEAHQEANEANLDLSLGLKSHDGERKAD